MAKKTAPTRAKTTPKPAEETAVAPAAKPRGRVKAPKRAAEPAETMMSVVVVESTEVSIDISPTEEDIRVRAYHRYLERGGDHGMDFEDWLEAERDLRRRK